MPSFSRMFAVWRRSPRSLPSSQRAEAVLLGESSTSSGGNGAPTQNYSQMQEQISQRVADTEAKLDALNKTIESQAAKNRNDLLAQRRALSGQIELDKALLDAIQKMW